MQAMLVNQRIPTTVVRIGETSPAVRMLRPRQSPVNSNNAVDKVLNRSAGSAAPLKNPANLKQVFQPSPDFQSLGARPRPTLPGSNQICPNLPHKTARRLSYRR